MPCSAARGTHSLVRVMRIGVRLAYKATTVGRQWRKGPARRAYSPTSSATTSRLLHGGEKQAGMQA